MIPLRDSIPCRTRPVVVYALLAINIGVFLIQLEFPQLTTEYGVKPSYVTAWWNGEPAQEPVLERDVFGRERLTSVPEDATLTNTWLPFLTSMFLHGGILHLVFNMIFLWIFADNVEDIFGHGRFLAFYLVCGVAASAVHTGFELDSNLPTIGASGAIAGVLGAYFVCFPHSRVLVAVPIFFLIHFMEVPAVFFLGLWFLLQVFTGLGDLGGHVAVWAHAGGFVTGLLLALMIPRDRRRRPRPVVRYRGYRR